jgi:hypothetical protein
MPSSSGSCVRIRSNPTPAAAAPPPLSGAAPTVTRFARVSDVSDSMDVTLQTRLPPIRRPSPGATWAVKAVPTPVRVRLAVTGASQPVQGRHPRILSHVGSLGVFPRVCAASGRRQQREASGTCDRAGGFDRFKKLDSGIETDSRAAAGAMCVQNAAISALEWPTNSMFLVTCLSGSFFTRNWCTKRSACSQNG